MSWASSAQADLVGCLPLAGSYEGYAHSKVDGARLGPGARWRGREEMQSRAATLGYGGHTGGDPVLLEGEPRALLRAGLGLSARLMRGLGMFIVKPARTPLAYGAKDVLGLSLARLPRAGGVVVCHVGPGAGLV